MWYRLVIPLLLLLAVAPGAAAQTGTVAGRVASEAGIALTAAQVSIPGTSLGGFTDEDGRYRIENVPAGEVQVRAELIGFAPVTLTATVASGETVSVDFELPDQALALDEIVVTGQAGQARRREVGNAIVQIDMATVAEPINTVENLIQNRATGVRSGAPRGARSSSGPRSVSPGVRPARSTRFARSRRRAFGTRPRSAPRMSATRTSARNGPASWRSGSTAPSSTTAST